MPDLILGPIAGGLSATHANLWARADGPATLHAWLGRQPDLSDALPAGASPLDPENGCAGVVPLDGLAPDTRYHYALTLSASPPDPARGPYPTFATFPPAGERRSFAFAFGSCFRPEFEHSGQTFRALEARRRQDDLRFILMLGDQIYSDDAATNRLSKVAATLDDYRAVYAFTWSRPPLRELLANLPAFMTMDDHEVDDDWCWTDRTREHAHLPIWDRFVRWRRRRPPEERRLTRQRVQNALQAYWEHQLMHAPPLCCPPTLTGGGQYALSIDDPGSLAYTFDFGAAAFFVLDTRTCRVRGGGQRTVLGAAQWEQLTAWLLAVKEAAPVKFIVTSIDILYDMWVDITRDRWSGYPEERDRLLGFIAEHEIEGVRFLSGDLHVAHAASANLRSPRGRLVPVAEFGATPFEQRPNRVARRTYIPVRSPAIHSQQLLLSVAQHNFGLVRVDLESGPAPRVAYEVYGSTGNLLARTEA